MRKPIIILSSLFIFSTLLHISCSKNDDGSIGCEPIPQTDCYKMKNVQVLPYNYVTKNTVGTTDSVRRSDFALQLNVENESVMCFNNNRPLYFMNTAYACSPEEPKKYKTKLVDFTIKSNKALNSKLPAGADLSGYFFLERPEQVRYSDNFVYYFDYYANELTSVHYLKLSTNDIDSGTYSFTITFTYEDGTRETATTNSVRIVR